MAVLKVETLEAEVAALRQQMAAQERELQAERAGRWRAEAALHQSQTLLHGIIDHASAAIFVRDLHGTLLLVNRALALLLRRTPEALQGRNCADLVPPERMAAWQERDQHILATGEPIEGEEIMMLDDGTHTFLMFQFPIFDAHGTIYAIGAISTDMTEQKQAEQALADSEARYRTLVETSPGAILLTDLDSTIRFCNQRAVELFGYHDKEELCGMKGTDLVVIADATDPVTYVEMLAGSGNIRNIEYTLRRRDGRQFVAEVSSSIVADATGHPTDLIIVVHDISQRKQAEEALTAANNELTSLNDILLRSRNFLRDMFDGIDDGLVLLDHTGTVRIINATMAALLNNAPQQLVGQHWQAICPFPGCEHIIHAPPHNPAQQRNHQRIRHQSEDGTIRLLDMQTILLQSASQDDEQTIIHVVDVTEPVTLQARVLENERFAASGRLAASVAHEINTPLQSIAFALELARIAPEHERTRYLEDAIEEINWAGRIVHQLLDLYRPGAATHGPIDIHMLLERILLLIGKRIRDQGVVIERDLAANLPAPHGRADELMQVILNLLVNALDAMPNGGRLHIATAPGAPSGITIAITDSGCGIRPELQAKIFEPFVTTREEGTGLGLSISAQIIKQHGGSISVVSEPGNGSTFTILLPLAG